MEDAPDPLPGLRRLVRISRACIELDEERAELGLRIGEETNARVAELPLDRMAPLEPVVPSIQSATSADLSTSTGWGELFRDRG